MNLSVVVDHLAAYLGTFLLLNAYPAFQGFVRELAGAVSSKIAGWCQTLFSILPTEIILMPFMLLTIQYLVCLASEKCRCPTIIMLPGAPKTIVP